LDIAALEAVKIFARALWVANMQGIWKKISLSQVIDLRTTDGIPNWTTWAWSEKFDIDDHFFLRASSKFAQQFHRNEQQLCVSRDPRHLLMIDFTQPCIACAHSIHKKTKKERLRLNSNSVEIRNRT